MDTIKLISEAVEEVEYITEEKEGGGKNYKIKGIFLQADIKNRNGRVYPMEVLQKEVSRYNKKFINENRAYGCLLYTSPGFGGDWFKVRPMMIQDMLQLLNKVHHQM